MRSPTQARTLQLVVVLSLERTHSLWHSRGEGRGEMEMRDGERSDEMGLRKGTEGGNG